MSFSDSLLPRPLDRRRLARLIAGAAAAPTVAVALAPSRASAGVIAAPPRGDRRVRLRRDADSVVSAADVRLDDHIDVGRARPTGTSRTRAIHTTGFSMLGVTWRSGTGHIRVRVRRERGGWTDWRVVPRLHDGPDADSEEARSTPRATEPVWVGRADAVQVEISGTAHEPVLALIDPGRRPEDATVRPRTEPDLEPEGDPGRALTDRDRTPKPKILTRGDWGANPRLRSGTPVINTKLHQVHLHHTVNSNDYSRSDVPALIRGMYRYHTRSLGWSDLGYNFLIDRFGRIWVGRLNSSKKLVRGAHTLGFNHCSMGVSVIGNFEVKAPNKRIIKAIARLASWRVDAYDLKPRGMVLRRSQGSDHYPPGDWVRLPVIDGHRDTNDTACPGRYLYAALPRIRRKTAWRIEYFNSRG